MSLPIQKCLTVDIGTSAQVKDKFASIIYRSYCRPQWHRLTARHAVTSFQRPIQFPSVAMRRRYVYCCDIILQHDRWLTDADVARRCNSFSSKAIIQIAATQSDAQLRSLLRFGWRVTRRHWGGSWRGIWGVGRSLESHWSNPRQIVQHQNKEM